VACQKIYPRQNAEAVFATCVGRKFSQVTKPARTKNSFARKVKPKEQNDGKSL
jgi:hypothetical protein